jgi:branched-chain amino acid transport system substrate-binding protein
MLCRAFAAGVSLLLASGVNAEILLGAAAPLTGQLAWKGAQVEAGIRQAAEDLNAAGGLLGQTLEVVVADDYCDAEQALAAARKLIASDVAVIVGHQCSSAAIPTSELYESAGIPFISPFATNPQLTERGLRFTFRMVGRDDQQGEIAANYIAGHFLGQKVAILHDRGVYGESLAEETRRRLHERGIEEVLFAGLDPDGRDYSPIVEQLRDLGTGVIYYGGFQNPGGLLRRQTWEAGLQVPMVAGDGVVADDFGIIAGAEAAAATLATYSRSYDDRTDAAKIAAAMREKGRSYAPDSLHAYASVQAWVQAVQLTETVDGKAVAAALHYGTFHTVIGEIAFDAKGDLVGPSSFVWYTWRNGGFAPLDE